MSTDNTCPICNGTGVDPNNGRLCVCVIQKAMDTYFSSSELKYVTVPDELKNLRIDPEIHKHDFFVMSGVASDKETKSKYSTRPDSILYKGAPTNQFLKYYIAMNFMKNPEYTYLYHTGKDIFDVFMSSDMEYQQKITKVDLLVIVIGNDVKNSYLQELIPFVIGERRLKRKQTIVAWGNPGITDREKRATYIREKYGDAVYDILYSQMKIMEKTVRLNDRSVYMVSSKSGGK